MLFNYLKNLIDFNELIKKMM